MALTIPVAEARVKPEKGRKRPNSGNFGVWRYKYTWRGVYGSVRGKNWGILGVLEVLACPRFWDFGLGLDFRVLEKPRNAEFRAFWGSLG